MSVLIKDVDKILYSRFKSQAVLHGLKVGEALSLAMEKWLDNISSETEEELVRIRNNATYRRLFPELFEEHENRWVVISEGRMIGIYDTMLEAAKAIKSNNLYGKVNIITQITQETRKVRLGMRRRRES